MRVRGFGFLESPTSLLGTWQATFYVAEDGCDFSAASIFFFGAVRIQLRRMIAIKKGMGFFCEGELPALKITQWIINLDFFFGSDRRFPWWLLRDLWIPRRGLRSHSQGSWALPLVCPFWPKAHTMTTSNVPQPQNLGLGVWYFSLVQGRGSSCVISSVFGPWKDSSHRALLAVQWFDISEEACSKFGFSHGDRIGSLSRCRVFAESLRIDDQRPVFVEQTAPASTMCCLNEKCFFLE